MTTNYRKTKPTWERPSLNPMNPNARTGNPGDPQNLPRRPWDHDSRELLDEFERELNALDTKVTHPWEEGSYEEELYAQQREYAKQYKFNSIFATPEMSEERKRQLEEYKYNPPFNCGFNEEELHQKSAKKLNPDMKNPKTRDPWSYGELAAPPVQRKIHEKPKTALWSDLDGDKKKKEEVALASSGDPVLDHLRQELKNHGALGIAGLARKFRIMDDDSSGTLSVDEFRKGIKECGLTSITEKQIRHLFLYFGKFH